MELIGIFGGSFNPIHRGHLHAAALAREAARLERVIFVPASRPPHKSNAALAPDTDRMAMLKLAIEGDGASEVSGIELESGGPRFTIDTLDALQKTYPGVGLRFILGWDSLRDLPHWRDPEAILDRHGVIAVDRPGVDERVPALAVRCTLVRGNPFAISATAVRERAAAGLSLRQLVPDPVAEYIESRRLYSRDG